MSERTADNDLAGHGLQTCRDEDCEGFGRALWRSHERCPYCRGPLVAYVISPLLAPGYCAGCDSECATCGCDANAVCRTCSGRGQGQ